MKTLIIIKLISILKKEKMKNIICLLLTFFLSTTFYAQQTRTETVKTKPADAIELPAVVVKKAGKDFSVYIPDAENNDAKIRQIQDAFAGYELSKDLKGKGYKEYLVTLSIDDGFLAATYDEKGKITRVVEKYKNVKLPPRAVRSILLKYPDWKIVKDKFLYTQEDGDIKKKQYNVTLEKGNKTKKIKLNDKGDIL